jgi:hypothetical protein
VADGYLVVGTGTAGLDFADTPIRRYAEDSP